MSIVKSFSVGNGDMFYIKHNSDNFSVIDCCLDDSNKERIIEEIENESFGIGIKRFISTHPDDDHIKGLKYFDDETNIINFYCVNNEATKDDETEDFIRYCELRDRDNSFYLSEGCSRKWMNISDEERGCAGINVIWPIIDNEEYKKELENVKSGQSPNNISPIFRYSIEDGVVIMWMGDIEHDFIEKVKDNIDFPEVTILFAPHHGRKSGKLPSDVLAALNPKIVVIGEAPSEHLNYYDGYNTITQNSAGDITFECLSDKIRIYVSKSNYSVDFLTTEKSYNPNFDNYIGTLNL